MKGRLIMRNTIVMHEIKSIIIKADESACYIISDGIYDVEVQQVDAQWLGNDSDLYQAIVDSNSKLLGFIKAEHEEDVIFVELRDEDFII